jgi:hypothetical protein
LAANYQVAAYAPNIGPERIRSVRVRLVTRAALADRNANIPVAPANFGAQPYLYRYCMGGPCVSPGGQWARARTVTTEVALPNQQRNFY